MQVQRSRTAKIKVSGFVHGVGYRYFVLDAAVALGVRGYVRNLPGGEVEVLAEAEDESLQMFVEKLKEGPVHSRVENVSVEFEDVSGTCPDFSIKY